MKFTKANYILVGITILGFLSLSCSSELREIDTEYKYKKLILKHGTIEFTKDKWEKASSKERGKMVRSLFKQYRFSGKLNKFVDDLLGFRTCYIDYEDQPCYELIYDGNYYFLFFRVKHSNDLGRITDIEFSPRD